MLAVDFETRSEVELRGSKSVGLHNYAIHPSTLPLLLGWQVNDDPVNLWQIQREPMPQELNDRLDDPDEQILAYNAAFERYIFRYQLGITLPIERFQDPQASARYLTLPGSLEDAGDILGLGDKAKKSKEGKRLIDMFSKPSKRKKKRGEEVEYYFKDWQTDPEDWARFGEYCIQDIIAEKEVARRLCKLGIFPLPEQERKVWIFDQKVNDRGIPVDLNFVKSAFKLADREKEETIKENNRKTGLENSNSNAQLLVWVKQHGYDKDSLEKDTVTEQLKNNKNLDSICIEVLKDRAAAASTSYKKMSSVLRQVSPDNRLRNQFIYYGSSRCGRFSSAGGMQIHNLARPTEVFENEDNVIRARNLIFAEDYDTIRGEFGSVLLTVKSNIRTAFVAEKGNRFNVCDLNAVETRVGAWLAGCDSLLNGFRTVKDFDPYIDFAVKMTGIPYETLARDKKSKDPAIRAKAKHYRQIAKPGVLACIYRAGAVTLQAYAEAMGIEMSIEQAIEIVRIFRESYREIVESWYQFEDAIQDVLKKGTVRVKRSFGPNDSIKIDKIIVKDWENPILRIQLPSGRHLHYMNARIEETLMPWKDDQGNDVFKPSLVYSGQDQQTKQWVNDITSHGGMVYQNCTQAIARDVLVDKLLAFEERDLPVILHVHDEGGSETEDTLFAPNYTEMEEIMRAPVSWAPDLPLDADGFSGPFYHK